MKTLIKLITCLIPSKELRHSIRQKYIVDANKKFNYGDKHIYADNDAETLIYNSITNSKSSLICRFGGVEFNTLNYFLAHKNKKFHFNKKILKQMSINAGFFPCDDYHLSRFSSELLELIKDIDLLGVWNLKGEDNVCNKYLSSEAKLITLDSINPITYQNPWSLALKGKKVLVIHPFEESIKEQYKKHELLFDNKNILPDFQLITMKPVQSLADNKDNLPYQTWFDALDAMKKQIDAIDFDIAIIGAGAYGIFLAHHCKKIGKKAVHMGGATQVLFGIIGKRWETEYKNTVGKLINEHWTRPLDSEKPKGADKVEGGCYW